MAFAKALTSLARLFQFKRLRGCELDVAVRQRRGLFGFGACSGLLRVTPSVEPVTRHIQHSHEKLTQFFVN